MTGYQSKKAAALDEEGMYLVHQTQSAQKSVGFIDSKLNPIEREWVGLTEEDFVCINQLCNTPIQGAEYAEHLLKEKNT